MIKKWREINWKRLYFLVLLPLFFVFHGYYENYPMVAATDALLLFLKYALVIILVTSFLFVFIRMWQPAAVMAFFTMCFYFFFGPVHDLLKTLFPQTIIVKYLFLFCLTVLLFIAAIIFLRRKKPALIKFSGYLNILFVVLILIDAVQFVARWMDVNNTKTNLATGFNACDSCSKPDIYLIVADGYAGKKELQDIFKFDNSHFENELKQRGFHLVENSVSNYNYTPFTMASMFNMQYLQGIEKRNQSLKDRKICYTAINKNRVLDFFTANNYNIKNFSVFQFAGTSPLLSTSFYKTGVDLITAHTLGGRINRDIRFNLVTRLKIKSEVERVSYHELKLNEKLYQKTIEEAKLTTQQPRFIYTHLEMPHYPYYFDKDGNPYPVEGLIDNENHKNGAKYIEYLQYANQKFLTLIDTILANSKTPPVILFISDHGFREFKDEATPQQYQFMNFNAVYLPGKNYTGFYEGMSTVNQFRILLNTHFSQKLPLLKDSTIFVRE